MARAPGGELEACGGLLEAEAEEAPLTARELGLRVAEGAGVGAGAGPRPLRLPRTAAAALVAACLLAATAARALGLWGRGLPAAGGGAGEALSLVGVGSTNIRWLAHPDKCLDVAGKASGAALQIWDCDAKYPFQQVFLVPPDGTTGRIKWAHDPSLCLDSPGAHGLQFWKCDDAPAENLLWTVSPDGKGRIHWAAHPEQCVDVPDERTENGWKLQVWYCRETTRNGKDSNLRFITHPVDCQWGEWQGWGPCSASCGGGRRQRKRLSAVRAMNGGEACSGSPEQSERCGADPCGAALHAQDPRAGPAESPAVSTTPGILRLPSGQDVRSLETGARAGGAAGAGPPAASATLNISRLLPRKDVRVLQTGTRSSARGLRSPAWTLLAALGVVARV